MRIRLMTAALIAVCLLPAADLDAQQAARRTARELAPPPLPMRPVEFPPYTKGRLSNGAETIIVQHREQPVVTVSVYVPGAGALAEPEGRTGIAAMTGALLRNGTATRTARQIAEQIDALGAQLSTSASQDWATISVSALTGDIDAALEIMADVLLNPTFPADELEIERRRQLTSLQVELSQPAAVASRVFLARAYGDHPYGQLRNADQLRALTREDLASFHAARYKPDNALVVVAGDVDPDAITRTIERHLGAWTGRSGTIDLPRDPVMPDQRRIVFVHKPGAVQAAMRIGHTIVPATHADWPALTVALHLLGGGSSGWLFQQLREQKGFTYGAYASGSQRPLPGLFQMWGDVRNEVADSALAMFLELSERLRSAPVAADELEAAKAYLTGVFPLTIETPGQIAGQLASARLLGRPDDHVQTWRSRLAAVTAADVQRVARTHLHPDRAVIVVSGDAEALRAALEPFAPILMVDEHGNPVQ